MSMPSRLALVLAGLALVAQPLYGQASPSDALQALRQGFLHPPDDARPMVRWWWFGVAVTKPEILRELQQMKADGIGGAELGFVYPQVLNDPARGLVNLPFLSPAMLDAVRYAQLQGRELGLRIDVTLCSGWPYGGPNTPLSEAAERLRVIEVAIPANADHIAMPFTKWDQGDVGLAEFIAPGEPKHWDAAEAKQIPLQVSANSNDIHFKPADIPRVALFFIAGHTRQEVKRAAVGAEGYVLDPFSHRAVATHLAKVGTPLLSAFGSTPPYAIFSDSLEAYGADWTPDLPAEFLKRRGYDLIPHLPELVAGGTPAAERVRHDYGRTLTELINENYLDQIDAWAKEHHTRFRSQTYGTPAVSFSSQHLVALPEGEGPQWRAFSTLRWATSANHVFGNNVTSGETFTWLHSPVFRATPLDMKAEADIDFITGENQIIFHGWPYSPPASELKPGYPGWSLYAAAALNDHNPWHPVMPAVTKYITRLSWLLRQGKPANQVAILLPTDDAWAHFSPGHVSVTDQMKTLISPALISAILSAGYNADFIDADAIDSVGLGSHQILVIPPTDRIPVKTLKTIDAWSTHGGTVIAIDHLPTLDAEGRPLPDPTQLTKAIVVVPGTDQLGDALHGAEAPDLRFKATDAAARSHIGFIHRKLRDADIYVVVNTSNQPIDTEVGFSTNKKFAEQWNIETPALTSANVDNQPLHLAPYGARVFVFTNFSASEKLAGSFKQHSDRQLSDLSSDWRVAFPAIHTITTEDTLTDWIADPRTLHYSGEADYTRDFRLSAKPTATVFLEVEGGAAVPIARAAVSPQHIKRGIDGLSNPHVTTTGPGMRAYYDPPIREAALVSINGQAAGALWHPPYRLDVTKLLHAGINHIEIRVFNTALNAWSALPPHNYGPLIAKYGDRFQMQGLNQVKPIPSGILGSILLVTQGPQ